MCLVQMGPLCQSVLCIDYESYFVVSKPGKQWFWGNTGRTGYSVGSSSAYPPSLTPTYSKFRVLWT